VSLVQHPVEEKERNQTHNHHADPMSVAVVLGKPSDSPDPIHILCGNRLAFFYTNQYYGDKSIGAGVTHRL
jgi:hypothetical protein